jgi:hypothetical protein
VRQDSSMDVDFLPLFELLLDEVQVAPLLATSATEGAVRVTATKPGALPITAILPVFKGSPDKDLYTFQANPVFIAIPATSDGAVTDWTNATTTVQANKNGEPDATWTWVWTATNMTPSSGTGATATFTAMSADAGQVTFRGSKAGQKDIVGTLNIVKVKGQLPSGPLIGAGMALFSTTQTYIAVKFLGDGRIQVKRGSGGSYVNAALWAGNVSSANNVCMLWVDELGPDTLTSGTTGSWLALTTDREFVLQDISSGTHTVNLEVQIATDNTYEKILQGFGGLQLVVP